MNYEAMRHFADSLGLMFMAFLWIAFTVLDFPTLFPRPS